MAQKRNQLIVAELDLMAASLEAKGNADLASLIDEVSAELLTESTVVEAKAPKAKKAPKPAKSNNKRRKTNKKKASAAKVVISRADAKKILKAAHSELLDIASELLKDGDLKEARHIIRYAEEVKEEENKLLVTDMMPEEVPAPMAEDTEESEDEESDDDMEESEDMEESDEDSDEESDEDGLEDSDEDSDEEDYEEDEDIEAMLRKYELGDDSPAAPAVKTEAPATPATSDDSEECEEEEEEEEEEEDSKDDSKEESEEDSEEEEEEEEEEPKKEEKKEEKTEKDAKVKLFSLAKKLAAAGETKLAYDIADLLDRKN